MTQPQDKAPQDTSEEQNRFYLIFNEVAKASADDYISDVNLEEIEEMDQVRRMVVDVTEDPPHFVTST